MTFPRSIFLAVLAAALAIVPRAYAAPGAQVVEGAAEKQGSSLVAGSEGATLRIAAGTRLELSPNTRIRELMRSAKLYLGGPERTPTYVVQLVKGRIDAFVSPDQEKARAVLVRAPYRFSTILRAGSLVALARDGRSVVANRDGDVLIAIDSEWIELPPHQARAASEEHEIPRRHDLLPAPEWDDDSPGVWLAPGGSAKLSDLSWEPVAGASSYQIELFAPDASAPSAAAWSSSPTLTEPINVTPGKYEARVTAIDAMGLAGQPSAPAPIRVVGVELPPGAHVDKAGTVHLARGQSVRFVDASGLLVTRGLDGRWQSGNQPIVLHRNRPTRVFLRAPGQFVAESFVMRPQPLVRRIDFEPANPVWPGPEIAITVELAHENAAPLLSPEVLVGVEPIDVKWQRHGNILTAKVPPQSGSGPWVLRVAFRDPAGKLVARDFLEIARGRRTWMLSSARATSRKRPRAWDRPNSSISPTTSSTRAPSPSSTHPSGDGSAP